MGDRRGEPPDGRSSIERLEVDFAIPVYLTMEQEYALQRLLDEVTRAPCNQPVNGVHWVASSGSKPAWSQVDALFLGKAVDPEAPEHGEPTFDDSVFSIETCARPFANGRERALVLAEEIRSGDKNQNTIGDEK